MRRKGSGKTAQRVLNRLLDALTPQYPGVGIADEDFWFQTGDYVKITWDLARWGAHIPYRTDSGSKLTITVYSWDTMRQCAKGLTMFVPRSAMAHEYEVCAQRDPS